MVNFFLQGLENKWELVRETSSSQKFKVDMLCLDRSLKAQVDIHYTRPRIAHVSVVWVGDENVSTDLAMNSLFEDLTKIALRHGDYEVIDYSLSWTPRIFEGNYAMSYPWYKHDSKEEQNENQKNTY